MKITNEFLHNYKFIFVSCKKEILSFQMKKITHEYGSDITSKFDETERIHFVEGCQCFLGITDNTFSIVCDYRDLKDTFKIKQEILVEYL